MQVMLTLCVCMAKTINLLVSLSVLCFIFVYVDVSLFLLLVILFARNQAPVLRAISRCIALTREGHHRRAVRALASTTPLIDTAQPEKLHLLAKLHPLPAPHESTPEQLPTSATLTSIPADETIVKLVKQ